MADIRVYKELCDLPDELEKWGKKALIQIESPEKAHEAAKVLREKMDRLWNECPAQDNEEKVRYVLKQLGKAESVAEELKETHKIKSNPKADKKVGIICLGIAILSSIYPLVMFLTLPNQPSNPGHFLGNFKAGSGIGAAAVCAIVFLFLGMWLLLHNRKKEE